MGEQSSIVFFLDSSESSTHLLETLGSYRCYVERRREEALVTARRESPDLMLVDLTLPLRAGFTFLEQCAVDPVLSKIPIVVLVAEDDEVRQLRGMALGATAYVKRPFSNAIVEAQVRKLLKSSAFKRFQFPDEARGKATARCQVKIQLMGETAFVFDGPVRLGVGTSVEVESSLLSQLGVADCIMRTSKRPPYQTSTGVFSDEVTLVGVTEEQAQGVRSKIRPWGRLRWNL